MFSRLARGAAALFVAAAALFAQPAFAETVNGITVANTTMPNATHGAYSHQIVATASSYAGGFSFQYVSGPLPGGFAISPSGLVSGQTCDANGTNQDIHIRITQTSAPFNTAELITFRVQINGGMGTCSLTMAGAPPNGVVGTPYSTSLAASGGSNPKTYTITYGALPTGLSINAVTGAVTGTPTASGSYTFGLRASDGSNVGTGSYTILVTAPLNITPASLPNGQTTVAYSQAFGATGGTAPYTFSLASGALPNGLSLAGGALSGTPTKAGSYTFSINASDGFGNSGSRSYTVTIAGSNIVSLSALPNGMLATAYSATITSTAGVAPYTYTITAGAPPPGLVMSSAGVVSGTPTVAGSYPFTVTSTDANGNFGTRAYTVIIGGANTLTIAPASIPGGTRNAAYSQTITASGGTPAYTYTLDSGTLPAGITLAANGTLSGTPTATGTFNIVVRGTDSFGNYGTANYSFAIAAPTLALSPSTIGNGTNGVAVSTVNFTTAGGAAPYTYAVTAGALPNGLTLASDGTLSGTPATLAGTYNFSVTSTDAFGDTAVRGYAMTIASASIAFSPTSLPNATINTPYSATFSASGGASPYAYAVTSGALPPGLSLVNGVLSGTPTASGTFSFSITATDANGDTHTTSYTFTIDAVTIGLTPASLPNGTNGAAYSQSITASGGTGPYTFVVDSGALPTGLVLASDGTLSGTPAGAGTYNFVVRATDAATNSATQSYAVTIASATIAITPSTLSNATINAAYSDTFSASGGAGGYSYYVSAGSLPPGLSLAGNTLSGTPTASGTFNFTITVTDSIGDSASQAYTFNVDAVTIAVSPSTLPGGTNATAYNESLSASGGTGPYTYSLSAGALPVGLSFSSTGTLSGTPSAAGTYNFTVTATDANSNTGSQAYSVVIAAATITIAPASLPNATPNVAYSQSLTASGGAAPYTYSLSAGALPVGMSFSSAGVLSGTPTTAGTYNFTINATDANGDSASQAYTFVVDAVTITLPASLPNGTNATAYSQSINASGGAAPYTYSLSSGALPAGLSLASNGTLSGTPTAAGSYTFTVQATDANTNTGAQSYTVAIASALITITPASLPNCTNGTAYSHSLSATGGTGAYTFTLASGAMPVGMSLTSAGVFAGTPTSAGTYNFTVRATDGNGDNGTQAYSLAIGAASIDITPAALPGGRRGDAYTQALTAAGGTGPYTYSIGSGALPAGVTLAANGALSGTPTATGTFNVRIDAKDANGDIGQRTYALLVADPIALDITPGTLANGRKGTAVSVALLANGGTGPYTFAIASGALPTGVTLAANGTLSGTPTTTGTFTFTVRGNDNAGHTGQRTYSWVIAVAARPDPTSLRDVRDSVTEQFGAARRLGELQMGQVFRRLDSGAPCASAEGETGDGCKTAVEVWANGTRETSYVGSTSAINAFTVGADMQLGPARIGAALGTGDDLAELASGYRGDVDGKTWMLYGRVGLGEVFGIAALAGRTNLDMDSRRLNDGVEATFGHREGSTDFVAIELNATVTRGDGGLVPYIRYEKSSTDLDAYAETGGTMALGYNRVSADDTAFVAGAEAFYTKRYTWGSLTPRFRGEYRDRSGDDVQQALWYVDAPNSPFVIGINGVDDTGAMFSMGMEAAFKGFRVSLDWGTAGSSDDWFRGQSIRLQLRADF